MMPRHVIDNLNEDYRMSALVEKLREDTVFPIFTLGMSHSLWRIIRKSSLLFGTLALIECR